MSGNERNTNRHRHRPVDSVDKFAVSMGKVLAFNGNNPKNRPGILADLKGTS
jgi:hypothetical protein